MYRLRRIRHAEIQPIRGNARRRTLALLAVTGAAVLAAHFALEPGAASARARAQAAAAAAPQAPKTFYVSAAGKDTADGESPATAWRTLARAGDHVLRPGERLLLRGGDRFAGELALKQDAAGQAAKPAVLGSYGNGPAVIDAGAGPAVSVFRTAGVDIRDLILVGPGADGSQASGVDVYNDLPGNVKFDHVTITDVDVSGFRNGIAIGGGSGSSGFSDVLVSGSKVHGNRDNGLVTYGPPGLAPADGYAVENLRVIGVQAYDNLGDRTDHKVATGSGIDLGSVHTGLVEDSLAHGNGLLCDSMNGPVGIWTHDSAAMVLDHNVSYANRTGGYTDGGGFDLDQKTHDSVLEYNLTYDNDGPGYMVYAGTSAALSTGNIVRFNISADDARSLVDGRSITYGAVMLSGWEVNMQVYHNTVVQTTPGASSVLLHLGPNLRGSAVRDNIFSAQNGEVVDARVALTASQVLLQGNDYSAAKGHWRLAWGARAYTSLSSWRSAAGQELLKGRGTGLAVDPGLVEGAAAPWDSTHESIAVPRPGSPAAQGALDLAALFGLDVGPHDYLGAALTAPTAAGAVMPAAASPGPSPSR